MKVTGSKRVISLGGGGITANEAAVGMREDGVEWCVYALSRGREEKFPTLLNWAADTDGATLIKGKDPKESEGAVPWWVANKVIRGGEVRNGKETFSGDQKEKFGVDEEGRILDESKFKTAIASIRKAREDVANKLEEVDAKI